MRLTFTRRGGRHDELAILRDDGRAETLSCPKQGIIPHDMVHFAVESALSHRGFLGLVADGQAAAFTTAGGEAAIRTRLDQLSADWSAVPLNGSLTLHMAPGRGA